MGRHDEAHARLTRAWEELPSADTPEAVALQIELAVDGFYEMDFDQTLAMGARRPGRRRWPWATGALIASAASALALGEAASGAIDAGARAPRRRRWSRSTGSRTPSWRPGWRRLYYLGWAENYLERYDDAIAHADRGLAIARVDRRRGGCWCR